MSTPAAILDLAFERVVYGLTQPIIHLFHRLRMFFLETYQQLVLDEPDSAVSQPLKEAFLALRQTAESSKEELEE